MRVVAYMRVSTEKQVVEGLGLDVQREAIRKWASGNGNRIVGEFRDEGISGSNGLETRAGLGDAFEYLKRGKAEGLVVYRLDRLARDLVLQETLLAEIRKMDADLFSTSNVENGYLSDDDSDPSRALIRQVLGAVNQYERKMIRMRMLAGQKRKAKDGGYAGFGSPPLGQRAEGKELVADPAEQVTVRRIIALRGEGKSLRNIVVTLTEEGHKPKRSSRWHPQTIAKIIQRESPGQTLGEGVTSRGGLA